MKKTIQVNLRLPLTVIDRVKRTAKLASVTPTQVYRVLLAFQMETERDKSNAAPGSGETK